MTLNEYYFETLKRDLGLVDGDLANAGFGHRDESLSTTESLKDDIYYSESGWEQSPSWASIESEPDWSHSAALEKVFSDWTAGSPIAPTNSEAKFISSNWKSGEVFPRRIEYEESDQTDIQPTEPHADSDGGSDGGSDAGSDGGSDDSFVSFASEYLEHFDLANPTLARSDYGDHASLLELESLMSTVPELEYVNPNESGIEQDILELSSFDYSGSPENYGGPGYSVAPENSGGLGYSVAPENSGGPDFSATPSFSEESYINAASPTWITYPQDELLGDHDFEIETILSEENFDVETIVAENDFGLQTPAADEDVEVETLSSAADVEVETIAVEDNFEISNRKYSASADNGPANTQSQRKSYEDSNATSYKDDPWLGFVEIKPDAPNSQPLPKVDTANSHPAPQSHDVGQPGNMGQVSNVGPLNSVGQPGNMGQGPMSAVFAMPFAIMMPPSYPVQNPHMGGYAVPAFLPPQQLVFGAPPMQWHPNYLQDPQADSSAQWHPNYLQNSQVEIETAMQAIQQDSELEEVSSDSQTTEVSSDLGASLAETEVESPPQVENSANFSDVVTLVEPEDDTITPQRRNGSNTSNGNNRSASYGSYGNNRSASKLRNLLFRRDDRGPLVAPSNPRIEVSPYYQSEVQDTSKLLPEEDPFVVISSDTYIVEFSDPFTINIESADERIGTEPWEQPRNLASTTPRLYTMVAGQVRLDDSNVVSVADEESDERDLALYTWSSQKPTQLDDEIKPQEVVSVREPLRINGWLQVSANNDILPSLGPKAKQRRK